MAALPQASLYNRKSERYEVRASVDISKDHERASFGTLIDISRDGVGFFAEPTLTVGQIYLLSIAGIGAFSCKILHCTGHNRYGGVFQISEKQKRDLEPKILEKAGVEVKKSRVSRF